MSPPRPVAEVYAYADQFAEFASQVRGLNLDAPDVLTIGMSSDGTLIGTVDGKPAVIVRKDVGDDG